jgi:hypothetical protein
VGRNGKKVFMPRPLAPGTSVEHLRKEAKRWLKALRANDRDARDRLVWAWPKAPATAGLRDVQHALALEYGQPNWTALKGAAEALARGGSPRDQALHSLLGAADRGDVATLLLIRLFKHDPICCDQRSFSISRPPRMRR